MVNSTIYLFVGLSFTILGIVFLVYTLILVVQERNQRGKGIRDAIASSLEFEQGLQPQSLTPSESTPPPITNPYERLAHTTPVQTTAPQIAPPINKPVVTASSPPTAPIAAPTIDQTYDHEQLVMALETLVQHRALGIIDEETYNKRKKDLLHHPEAPKRAFSDDENTSGDASIDELLIDYMEGIITSTEYERRKAQLSNKSASGTQKT